MCHFSDPLKEEKLQIIKCGYRNNYNKVKINEPFKILMNAEMWVPFPLPSPFKQSEAANR